jgi:hypothetical protein
VEGVAGLMRMMMIFRGCGKGKGKVRRSVGARAWIEDCCCVLFYKHGI